MSVSQILLNAECVCVCERAAEAHFNKILTGNEMQNTIYIVNSKGLVWNRSKPFYRMQIKNNK